MARNNETQMLVDLGAFPNQHSFKEFTLKPKFCKRIKRIGLISKDYNQVSNSHELDIGIWLDNRKHHIGRYPVFLGNDPENVNNPKFIEINKEIDCSKEISGFVRASHNLNNANVSLIIILEK